jgi:hypothetical protein
MKELFASFKRHSVQRAILSGAKVLQFLGVNVEIVAAALKIMV